MNFDKRFYLRMRACLLIALLTAGFSSCSSSGASCNESSGVASGFSDSHLVILLDQSSSMTSVVSTVVDGFNDLVGAMPDSSYISLFGFESDNGLRTIFDYEKASSLRSLTVGDYALGSSTPLYDAISGALLHINGDVTTAPEGTTFVIISDGLENASTRYSRSETASYVRQAIDSGVTVRFFALGSDAAQEAQNLGIPTVNQATFTPDQSGVQDAFDSIGGSFNQSSNASVCQKFVP